MTEQDYLQYVNEIRKLIKLGGRKQLIVAEKNLDRIADIRPYRLVYFLAKAELMAKQDLPRQDIIKFLEYMSEGMRDTNQLSDLYQTLLKVIPDNETLNKTQYRFLTSLYEGKEEKNNFLGSLLIQRNIFLSNKGSLENLLALSRQYYIVQNFYMYFISMMLWCKLSGKLNNYQYYIEEDVIKLNNIGYLLEYLMIKKKNTFILVIDEQDDALDYEIAADILKQFGKNVVMIKPAIICPIDGDVKLEDTLAISIENVEEYDEIKRFLPIALVKDNICIGDNLSYLIAYITKNFAKDNLALIFSNDYILDNLQSREDLAKNIQRLSNRVDEALKNNMSFCWTGDYLSYIGYIYNCDVHQLISQPAECEFSIVVPARNSARTLRYTLKTCLEQRYQGNYEIILSDNSTDGNQEVYELCSELNSPKIKYIRTPRDLPLAKSFEFAFLQAKGEFVFSIGSDDGVLPWALDTLHNALRKIENEDILLWDRGFYAWPKFNGGQQNQLVINDFYKKDEVEIHKLSSNECLEYVFENPNTGIYTMLPNLYLNSGYRREYLKNLLIETGRLWDSCAQDVYMGAITLGVTDAIAYISYPITIAGMSGKSIGYLSGTIAEGDISNQFSNIINLKETLNQYTYIHTNLEELYPNFITVDLMNFYWAVLKLVNLNLLEKDTLRKLKWDELYLEISKRLTLDDVLFDKKIMLLRQAAQQINKETSEYVDNICKERLVPCILKNDVAENIDVTERSYKVGFHGNGHGMTLDASEFGVEDIHGAVKLFEKITGL